MKTDSTFRAKALWGVGESTRVFIQVNILKQLRLPLYNSASGQRTFHYRAVSIWNELPNRIKDIDTLNRFKLEYKRYLLHGLLESS